jgi:hypothetical protein
LRRARPRLILALLAACAHPVSAAAADPSGSILPAGIAMPQREQDFIAIFDKARRQYGLAKSVVARQGARIGMQIDLHEFLGLTHRAQDWVGTFRQSEASADGNRSIEIEIAPGVLISTWTSDYQEARFQTMIRPFSPLAPLAKELRIGEPVKFSADLIGSVISTDDDMVLRPRIIAQFDRLETLDKQAGK